MQVRSVVLASPRPEPVVKEGMGSSAVGVAAADPVMFSGKSLTRKKPLAVFLAGLSLLLVSVGMGAMMGVPGPGDRVTSEKVYSIDADRNFSLTDYDMVIDQADTGWEIRGNRKLDPNGFRFALTPSATGWDIRGGSIIGIRDYVAQLTPTGPGRWTLQGDREGTVGYGDFSFDVSPDGRGGFVVKGDKAWTAGDYDFKVTPTANGWQIRGGSDLRLDFRFDMERLQPGKADATEEEALAVSIPVIFTMARELDK